MNICLLCLSFVLTLPHCAAIKPLLIHFSTYFEH
nr:MAG TPA: hypothetical protein [Caudoviricetes sp.]